MKLEQILYGGDYNPEQWLDTPEILDKDIEMLKEAKINTVTMGMFSWSTLEPKEGEYHFEWLEGIINNLYAHGISTILATPSGARPKWMSDKYPEVLRVRDDRVRYLFGARHNHCYTSPIYREKIRLINMKLAQRFGNHKGVILWHLSNEYGGECHCPLCQEAFRTWLRQRYSSIKELNHQWATTFWSHTYQDFEQIESPSRIGEEAVHGLNLDWKRFVTYQTVDFAKWELKAIRDGGSSLPSTTNLMYNYKGLNYDKVAEIIDIVSWDTYPVWHKYKDIKVAWDNGLQHDFMRSLKHKPYLLMESCPSSTNWQGVSRLKRPGMLETASMQAIAHGSDSVLYFQIRLSRGSSEKFHGAVIDHYGKPDTRVFKEASKLGHGLSTLTEVIGSNVNASVALVYDIENRWALEDAQGPRNKGLYHYEAVLKSYAALRKYGVDVDVISQAQELSKYKFVVAPMLYLFRENIQEKIKEFVSGGGHLVMTYWSGIVNQNDLCFLGETPNELTEVLGLRRREIDALYDGEVNALVPTGESGFTKSYESRILCDLVELKTAKPLFTYKEEFYAGLPAVTENKYGKGMAYYVATDADSDFYFDFYEKLLEKAGVSPLIEGIVPEGVAVSSRDLTSSSYVFIQNFNNEITDISSIKIDGEIIYPMGGNSNTPNFDGKMEAYSTIVYRRSLHG